MSAVVTVFFSVDRLVEKKVDKMVEMLVVKMVEVLVGSRDATLVDLMAELSEKRSVASKELI